MDIRLKALAAGTDITVVAIEYDRKCPFKDYSESLDTRDRKKAHAEIRKLANHYPPENRQKYKQVQGDLHEFKPDSQQRIFCFRREGNLIMMNGYKKKTNKLDPSEINKAKRIMQLYTDNEVKKR